MIEFRLFLQGAKKQGSDNMQPLIELQKKNFPTERERRGPKDYTTRFPDDLLSLFHYVFYLQQLLLNPKRKKHHFYQIAFQQSLSKSISRPYLEKCKSL